MLRGDVPGRPTPTDDQRGRDVRARRSPPAARQTRHDRPVADQGRSDLSWDESVRIDLYYVRNRPVMSDLIILWRTGRRFCVLPVLTDLVSLAPQLPGTRQIIPLLPEPRGAPLRPSSSPRSTSSRCVRTCHGSRPTTPPATSVRPAGPLRQPSPAREAHGPTWAPSSTP